MGRKKLARCVICGDKIRDRDPEGKAKTCTQECAGVLAWETIGKKD